MTAIATVTRAAQVAPPPPDALAPGQPPAARPAIVCTLIRAARPPILTKKFSLKDGKLTKTSVAQLTDGTAEQVAVADLAEFKELLDRLPANAAILYGVADGRPRARIVAEGQRDETGDTISRSRKFFGFRRAPGIMMLDHDPDGDQQLAPQDLIASIRSLAPCLAAAPMLWRPSASSGITGADGVVLSGITGQRLYIPVTDAALIPDAGAALIALLWAKGHGHVVIGKAGQALDRTLADASVWQPERLDFAAPPALGQGLLRQPPAAFIDGDPCGWLDLADLIAAADGGIQSAAAAAKKAAHELAKPALTQARTAWIDEQAPLLAARTGGDLEAAVRTLERACVKRELTGDFLLTADDGKQVTVGALLDNPGKWHGRRFADPLEPGAYGGDRRIAWANLRSGGRASVHSHAHGGRRFTLIRPSRRIELKAGDRDRVVDSLLDLLRARGDLYDLGEGASLTRISEDARALPISPDWLIDHLDRVGEFYTVKTKTDDAGQVVRTEPIEDAPLWAARRILAKDGERDLPRLDAVVTAPTLRADGSILAQPGYDAASRLLFVAADRDLATIPHAPTLDQAKAALARLWAPVRSFPYVDAVDCGVVLAGLLTACVRPSLPTAPGFGIDSPTAGTGKTLLAQCLGALSLGHAPPALPPASGQDDEVRKRLFSALREGTRVIVWDNVGSTIGTPALDAFLTAPTFADRILGASQLASLPNRALFICTGNNLRLVGDTCRRILTARIDAGIERPYARMFDFCPLAFVAANRQELVAAALTIIRAHITAGRPRHGEGRTASFETWDDLVRQAVCWVSTWDHRFSDPLIATDRARAHDPETAKLAALLVAWDGVVGSREISTAKLIELAAPIERDGSVGIASEEQVALRDAIDEIASDRGYLNRRILGRWIERHLERRHHGLRLARGEALRGSPQWYLAKDAETVRVAI